MANMQQCSKCTNDAITTYLDQPLCSACQSELEELQEAFEWAGRLTPYAAPRTVAMPPARQNNRLLTFTGRRVDPAALQPSDVCAEDIAHALSLTCRFGGHCREFYSVAQHSVLVAEYLGKDADPLTRLYALLHDASEAYLVDVPRPIKHRLRGYYELEISTMQAIWEHFGLTLPSLEIQNAITQADDALLATEMEDLMGPPDFAPLEWDRSIRCMPPEEAEERFAGLLRTLLAATAREAE